MPIAPALHVPMPPPVRDPAPLLAQTLREWNGKSDLWVFGYASLIWNPEFDFVESRPARVHGWHRALKMWSRVNRGTPDCPGLVFCMLSGGSCLGQVFRIPHRDGAATLERLWAREMPTGVYDPRWLQCHTPKGPVRALAFTLARSSPNYTGDLSAQQYQQIFSESCGRYGSTLDYARLTLNSLAERGIEDTALRKLLAHAGGATGFAL